MLLFFYTTHTHRDIVGLNSLNERKGGREEGRMERREGGKEGMKLEGESMRESGGSWRQEIWMTIIKIHCIHA